SAAAAITSGSYLWVLRIGESVMDALVAKLSLSRDRLGAKAGAESSSFEAILADRRTRSPAPPPLLGLAHDEADHLGHRLVVLARDGLIDLDRSVQSARQRGVLDHRHIVG